MADVPANQKLWNMLVLQAKAKFAKWPSLPASRWVHEQYVDKGGRFISEGQAAKMEKSKAARGAAEHADRKETKDKHSENEKKGEK